MTAKQQYDGRLYSQAEVDKMIAEAQATDRKKHELEARLSEREAVSREQSKPILTTNERIAELKQELEKL